MKTKIEFEIEKELEEDFDKVCDSIGIPPAVVFNMVAKTVVRSHSIPYDLVNLSQPIIETGDEYLKKLDRSFAQYEEGRVAVHDISEVVRAFNMD
ncbi:MAG: type II toxin-antitoxin system RelB/DinJ family antitoxin [Ruminococcus sp.]|nr:type II toxin-antitoxin system RelB/DinJ family antitoxin [Ruminococcus sp.]